MMNDWSAREVLSALAMQAVVQSGLGADPENVARLACDYADALIAECAKRAERPIPKSETRLSASAPESLEGT